jgi:hypothetical protein
LGVGIGPTLDLCKSNDVCTFGEAVIDVVLDRELVEVALPPFGHLKSHGRFVLEILGGLIQGPQAATL